MRIKFFILFFMLISISSFNLANANDENIKIDNNILNDIHENGEASVIIVYKEHVNKDSALSMMSTLSPEKDNKHGNLNSADDVDFKIRRKYSIINGVYGDLTEKGLNKLLDNNLVDEIYYDYVYHADLQNTSVIVNASLTHSRTINDINITGKDIGICILDTGINYTHPYFGGCSTSQFLSGSCQKVLNGTDYVNNDSDPYDNQGHGTNVAGIAAANIIGIAPNATILSVKVCNDNPSSTCTSGDIASGMEWCIQNKDKYNISVISMSFGSASSYSTSSPCPSSIFNIDIANANANGMLLVASAGNTVTTSGIAHPACNANVTAAGGVDKNDALDFSRSDLLKFVAPGISINTTNKDGLFSSASGTSFSAPHISGAIALLLHYKKVESNQSLNLTEIENALKNGKNITDTTGLNFTRINIIKALESIDSKNPQINLSISNARFDKNSLNITLNFSSIDTNLNNNMINVTYPNGSLLFEYNNPISGSNLTLTLLNYSINGNYTVVLRVNDSNKNFNITVQYFEVTPYVILTTGNFLNSSTKNINFSFTGIDDQNISNFTIYINSSGSFIANKSISATGLFNITNISINNLQDGDFLWNILVSDNNSNSAFYFDNFTVSIDTTVPIINLTHPVNNSINNSALDIDFMFNATDVHQINNCTLNINSLNNKTIDNPIINGIEANITINLRAGTYNWSITCTDSFNNRATSESRNFSTLGDLTKPIISSVSSSPGSTSATITWTTDENANSTVNYGTNQSSMNSAVNDNSFTRSHSVSISSLSSSTNYYYNVTSCDINSNCASNSQGTFTTSASSGNGGNSGGGGGGGGGGGSSGGDSVNTISSGNTAEEKTVTYNPTQYTDNKKSVINQAKEIIDSNPELKKGLEKDYGNENVDFGIVKDANIKRTLVANSGSSTISVAVKYSGNESINDFLVYDEIPKSFAENIKDIKIRAIGSKERTVINEDPTILFKYENVGPGKEFEIVYDVNKKVNINVLDEFKQPVILEKVIPKVNVVEIKENNQINRSKNYILFIIIGIAVIIALIYFVIKKDKKF